MQEKSRTAAALKLWNADPEISIYKAALLAGVHPSNLLRAIDAQAKRIYIQSGRCPTCGSGK